MVDIAYKLWRIQSYSRICGWLGAIEFEISWTVQRRLCPLRLGPGRSTWVRRHSKDLGVFTTTYVNRELELEGIEPGLIIDGGANIGMTTRYLAERYPDATIVAVEPEAENLEMLRRNTRGLSNVRIEEAGLWPFAGRLRISDPDAETWAFQCEPTTEDDPSGFNAVTVDGLIAKYGGPCALLKLDIEGGETPLLSAPEAWIGDVRRILVEVHGEEAHQAALSACTPPDWSLAEAGEKLDFTRTS